MLELKLLGIPSLFQNGEKLPNVSAKALALLTWLSLHERMFSRKELSELLWQTSSSASLRVALTELRNLPESEQWFKTPEQLVGVSLESDVSRFESMLKVQNYQAALNAWNHFEATDKSFMLHFDLKKADDFMNWVEIERVRLKELYPSALQGLRDQLEAQKDYTKALHYAEQMIAADRLNEDAWRALIRLEHKRGNTEAALEHFENLRLLLKEELAVEPLEETLELLAEIQQGGVSAGKKAFVIRDAQSIPARVETLLGRDSLLNQIDEYLKKDSCILLQGFGGTGKSALAAKYVENWLTLKQGMVVWLQAGEDGPDRLVEAIAQAFDVQQEFRRSNNPNHFLKQLFLQHEIGLVVLDDVWNAYALSKLTEALPNNLPVIITARQRYPKVKRIDVGSLSRKDAVDLINVHAQTSYTLETLDSLCKLLGDHAFALRIAGITLKVNELRPEELVTQIRDQPHTIKIPAEFAEEGRESVSSLLSVSTQALVDSSYEALMAFGVLVTSSCSPELLALCTRRSVEETEDALIDLQRRGLAQRQSKIGSDVITFQLHDLIFSFAKANNNLRESTFIYACHNFLQRHKRNFEILDEELENILGSAQIAATLQPASFVSVMKDLVVGDAYFQARGHTRASLELLTRAVSEAENQQDHSTAHYLLARLGDTYRVLYADYDKALIAYHKALNLAKELQDQHREAVLLSLIGGTRFQQAATDVDDYFEQAYQLARATQDDLALSLVLQHRGFVAGKREDWQAAHEFSLEAVSVAERLCQGSQYTSSVEKLFFALLNLGETERKLGDFEKALMHRHKALAIAKKEHNELWQAYASQEIGEMYHDANQPSKALHYFQDALGLYQSNNARADIETLISFLQVNDYKYEGE